MLAPFLGFGPRALDWFRRLEADNSKWPTRRRSRRGRQCCSPATISHGRMWRRRGVVGETIRLLRCRLGKQGNVRHDVMHMLR